MVHQVAAPAAPYLGLGSSAKPSWHAMAAADRPECQRYYPALKASLLWYDQNRISNRCLAPWLPASSRLIVCPTGTHAARASQ
jgi:hypothetical protein